MVCYTACLMRCVPHHVCVWECAEAGRIRRPTEELIVSHNAFGLQDDLPEAALDSEWRALVCQQAHTLAGMLQRVQVAVAGVPRRTNAHRLQALAADAERLLAAQAQQHVSLERELGQLWALVTDLRQAPVELTQRVHKLERVLAVLHTNLAAARQWMLKLREDVGE